MLKSSAFALVISADLSRIWQCKACSSALITASSLQLVWKYKILSWLFFDSQKGTALSTMILMVPNSAESLREGLLLFLSGMKFTSLPFLCLCSVSLSLLSHSVEEEGQSYLGTGEVYVLAQVQMRDLAEAVGGEDCLGLNVSWILTESPTVPQWLLRMVFGQPLNVVISSHGLSLAESQHPHPLRRVHSTLQRAGRISPRGLTQKQKILALALSLTPIDLITVQDILASGGYSR